MDRNKLKTYAQKARRDFIKAVTEKAALLGLSKKTVTPIHEEGDVAIIDGRPFPRTIAPARKKLEEKIEQASFDAVIEAIAYTWFNRFVALRYMEIHGYLGHGFSVLSHPNNEKAPQILQEAENVEFKGIEPDRVIQLKLAGDKDAELYRLLLLAQCNELHDAMPFLFERLGDHDELLLPDNLLHTGSIVRELVNEIPDEDWQDVEIIGWLYQYYISEKKDEVIGKTVKTEDIPAATQLFTPNWIVKYMVQNTLGAHWLATYPDSGLRKQMDFYIEPGEQTDEVTAKLAEITPKSIDPETLTFFDPACGSGHILVEAYDLFKAIYLERGYRQRDVPSLILSKNLFGLDIDERAAQLANFCVMMKARADDRRFFSRGVRPTVYSILDGRGSAEAPSNLPLPAGLNRDDLSEFIRSFSEAKNFGSLIRMPRELVEQLPSIRNWASSAVRSGDIFGAEIGIRLRRLLAQAELLERRYDFVVANPPYMGTKGMNPRLRDFARKNFPNGKSDLFACFIERCQAFAKDTGVCALVTMQSWMFLSSFQKLREELIASKTILTMAQIGFNSFPSLNSKIALATVFSFLNRRIGGYKGTYRDLNSAAQSADKEAVFLASDPSTIFTFSTEKLRSIPTSPLVYWASDASIRAFEAFGSLRAFAQPRQGLATTDNDLFLRSWFECSLANIILPQDVSDETREAGKWFPCNKGGSFRKWYGNNEYLVNWEGNGRDIKSVVIDRYGSASKRVVNEGSYFLEGCTWTSIGILFSMRYSPPGFIFETKGPMCFPRKDGEAKLVAAFCNTVVATHFLKMVSPTLDFHEGPIGHIPMCPSIPGQIREIADRCVEIGISDWNVYETSWDFESSPLLNVFSQVPSTLESAYATWTSRNRDTTSEMKRLEEASNRLFAEGYGLEDELVPEVPIEQITLTVNPAYRYGATLSDEERWSRFRQDTIQELISYTVGCMMGRYSLDKPGLVYAQAGNEDFDPNQYKTFPADDDGIVPLTDTEWFWDDATNRCVEFIAVAWPKDHLEENLQFVAENLSPKKGEEPRQTIRRYFSQSFFKDHIKTYKKRPIYWLFSSGKQKALECLVYLHRYNEGTLSRMRMQYVVPLQGKINARIDQLKGDIDAASSTANRKKLQKERDKLIKQRTELVSFDEKLRHYADKRIHLDLDDGVKVNYGKFGDLLAEVKAVTGKK